MQNLLVTAARPKGMFEIIAGDRRYLGAMMLAEAGEIVAADYDVPVKIITGDEADLREVSLTENFQREQMTVAEECVAFQHFLKTDGDVDAVAKRFGQTRRFIDALEAYFLEIRKLLRMTQRRGNRLQQDVVD